MEMLTRFLNRERFASLAELKREGGTTMLAIKQTLLLDIARTCSEKIELPETVYSIFFFEWDYRVFERLILQLV